MKPPVKDPTIKNRFMEIRTESNIRLAIKGSLVEIMTGSMQILGRPPGIPGVPKIIKILETIRIPEIGMIEVVGTGTRKIMSGDIEKGVGVR